MTVAAGLRVYRPTWNDERASLKVSTEIDRCATMPKVISTTNDCIKTYAIERNLFGQSSYSARFYDIHLVSVNSHDVVRLRCS